MDFSFDSLYDGGFISEDNKLVRIHHKKNQCEIYIRGNKIFNGNTNYN
jgi:hypothetical protein